MLYLLPPSVAIHGILSVQFMCLTFFLHSLSSTIATCFAVVHTHMHTTVLQLSGFCPDNLGELVPEENSPTHTYRGHQSSLICILICFAVVPKLYHLILVSLNSLLGTLSFSLMPHIHLTILICAR